MRFAPVSLLLLGAGCRQLIGIDDPAVGADAAIDSEVADARACFGKAPFEVCVTAPFDPYDFAEDVTLGTDKVENCSKAVRWSSTTQPDACFVVGAMVTIQKLRARGSRPLVIVATGTLSVTGLVDVSSSTVMQTVGAGAPSALCMPSGQVPAGSISGSGGGGGGSFGTTGGDGGNGSAGGGGKGAAASAAPMVLRAGCPGQSGGVQGGASATGGAGGGAIYLVAGDRITLGAEAVINASGAGARPATSAGGGGAGGGSGGMILLYAPIIEPADARLVANGGGGSGGSSIGVANGGGDPSTSSSLPSAAGGSGAGAGGTGGNGGSATVSAQPGASTGGIGAGGGGGGGGVGYIVANVLLKGAVVSPPVTVPGP